MIDTPDGHGTAAPVEAASGHRDAFLKGLAGGVLIGAAASLLFAPGMQTALRTARRRVTEAAAGAGDAVVDDLRHRGRDVYGKALSVVIRGAEDVRERATQAQGELNQPAARTHARTS